MAVIGLALSGVAVGQVVVPDLADGAIKRQVGANASANPAAPAVDSATSANVNADGNVSSIPGPQVDGVKDSVDATARANGRNINSEVQSNTNAGADALQNRADVSQNSNAPGNSNANPFGATFDSSSTDRLIIQNLQPNSAASRLGLQPGDRIIQLNGQTYADASQFNRDLTQLNGNHDVPITYERNGQRFTQSFRMSASNGQQTFNNPSYENQSWNTQSGNFGQISHSTNRPIYGVSSHSEYTGDMNQGHGYGGAGSGGRSHHGSACCGESVHSLQCCSVNRSHGHHRGHYQVGRRHRHNCR